jgi:spoIIIJ-associated protein
MEAVDVAQEILDTMLGYLGFVVKVEKETGREEPSLQVVTQEPKPLIGRHGDRLEDIQYLVNRLLQVRIPDAPRIRVDVDHYRATREYRLLEEADRLAERVIKNGRPAKTEPLNSFHRRLVHNHFLNHPSIKTWSPKDSARLKRISLLPKKEEK